MILRVYSPYVLILALIFGLANLTRAQEKTSAQIFSMSGRVEIAGARSESWASAQISQELKDGNLVRTLAASKAAILFSDGIIVRLNENTVFEVQQPSSSEQPLSIQSGEGFFFSRKPRRFPTVNTPTVSAAVRGTEFNVRVAADGSSEVAVLDGHVLASNKYGEVEISGGELAKAVSGRAPTKALIVSSGETVQWAVSVPPILSSDAQPDLIKAQEHLFNGQVALASSQLKQFLNSSTLTSKTRAQVLSLQAIIALVTNEKDHASTLILNARSVDPTSTSALMAASYLAQSRLDITQALDLVRQIVNREPTNRLARVRLAELLLATGNRKEATTLISQLGSSDARVSALSGFIELADNQYDQAARSFNRAIELNDALAIAYLGRGLAKIARADLEDGRRDLEKAAALDPLVSVYRSYLGKAYFEEEKESQAAHEYDRAISLDPLDPTPYLYRAYHNLSQNNVVGALGDVEDSISRNNNRAVYRSSLLLDKDAAVRSAGLAEVFSSLGFSRAAEIEAIKAISKDYSNYAAHRFLSDSYLTIDKADARVSEGAITEILAPLSFNLLNSSSSVVSVNEYNALFDRNANRANLRFSGTSFHDNIVPEAFVAGRTDQFGYVFGAQAGLMDGSRDNDFSHDYRFRAGLQYQPDSENRLVSSFNYLNKSAEDQDSIIFDSKYEQHDVSLGYNSQLSPASNLLFQVTHRNTRNHLRVVEDRLVDLEVLIEDELIEAEDGVFLDQLNQERIRDLRAGIQYLYNGSVIGVAAGVESYSARIRRTEESEIITDDFEIFDDAGIFLESIGEPNLDSQSVYFYPTWHLTNWLDVTTGIKYEHLELEQREFSPYFDDTRVRTGWLPKLGAAISATDSLTFRMAYFESLRKAVFEDAGSLEPTLVGGINQVYTDFSGTRSRNYGAGVDYKLAKSAYFGGEYIHRDVIERDTYFGNLIEIDGNEGIVTNSEAVLGDEFELFYDVDSVRGYYYQVLSDRFVLANDYFFSYLENTDEFEPEKSQLHKIASSLRYFDPKGWFAFVTTTWREQDRNGSLFVEDGNNDFWVVDAGVGYRFPKRHGSIQLKALNLFDNDFKYDQTDGVEEFVYDDLAGQIVLTLNF